LPNWNDQKGSKYLSKRDRVGVIHNATKGGFNAIAVLEDLFCWVSNPCGTEAAQMACKGVLIKDWRVFVSIAGAWLWN
jgi:hypothetical protein